MIRPTHTTCSVAVIIAAFALIALARADDTDILSERIRNHIQFLSSDALGGRAPGSEGEALALAYLRERFDEFGFAPGGDDGRYLQSVPLVGSTVTNTPALVVSSPSSREQTIFQPGGEFVCWTLHQQPTSSVAGAEMVFAGYGIVAPEYGWNDYEATDVAGKAVVILAGDPPSDDPSLFAGSAMTYYGRWTYKFEEAARQGAVAAILVHDTRAAGYDWSVVEASWSGEQFNVVLGDGGASLCTVESWIEGESARRLFSLAGRDFGGCARLAGARGFVPIPLGLVASVRVECALRRVDSNNFIARLDGNDSLLKDECVVYTAHWDHLGVGKTVDGDSIYNGALDNASGVAGLLEVARAFGKHSDALARSVVFVMTTAEESGLLGAYYYTDHPLCPLERTVAAINVDGLNVWGPTRDMVVVGYGQSDLDSLLADVLAPVGRRVAPDSAPEKGYYYRSDHFAFAKKGVPALYSDSGVDVVGKPSGWGIDQRDSYNRTRYHKPQDEYDESWNLAGAADDMRALYYLGFELATTGVRPRWNQSSEFRRIRERSLRSAR